jgi:hypothetical protein
VKLTLGSLRYLTSRFGLLILSFCPELLSSLTIMRHIAKNNMSPGDEGSIVGSRKNQL